jgi:hypothetical protein
MDGVGMGFGALPLQWKHEAVFTWRYQRAWNFYERLLTDLNYSPTQ